MSEKIDIVILIHNRFLFFEKMFKSIQENTDYPYRLIIVNNGSNEKLLNDYLNFLYRRKKIDILILSEENKFLKGFNLGLAYVKSKYFCISDPDLILPKDWLSCLVSYLDQYPQILRVGLSLSMQNIPSCWNNREKKLIAFKKGRYFKDCKDLILKHVVTTTQLIRSDIFFKIFDLEKDILNFEFFKKTEKFGISAVTLKKEAIHLGWEDWKYYPYYLIKKNGIIGNYRELSLIKSS